MEEDIKDRLDSARIAIRDDIRGIFRNNPEYRDYLVTLMADCAKEVEDLREQVPAPGATEHLSQ